MEQVGAEHHKQPKERFGSKNHGHWPNYTFLLYLLHMERCFNTSQSIIQLVLLIEQE